MREEQMLFSGKDLQKMITLLFLEQLLVMLVGMADTLVVSYAGESASQLLLFSTLFSVLIAVLVLVGNKSVLRLLFGRVEDSVMQACITSLEFPLILIRRWQFIMRELQSIAALVRPV